MNRNAFIFKNMHKTLVRRQYMYSRNALNSLAIRLIQDFSANGALGLVLIRIHLHVSSCSSTIAVSQTADLIVARNVRRLKPTA